MRPRGTIDIELIPYDEPEFFGVEHSRDRILVGYRSTSSLDEQVETAINNVEDALLDRISDDRPLRVVSDSDTHHVAVNVAVAFKLPLVTRGAA